VYTSSASSTVSGSILDQYLQYDPQIYKHYIYLTDRSIVPGPYAYKVQLSFLNYQSYGPIATGTGQITLVDACDAPELVVDVHDDIESDYTMAAVFSFPTTTVTPGVCVPEVTFTCQYLSGPYSGAVDLCADAETVNNGAYNTVIDFNPQFGSYYFFSNDKDTFQPGDYKFRVSISVGSTVIPVDFTMTLHEPCDDAVLTIVADPFSASPF